MSFVFVLHYRDSYEENSIPYLTRDEAEEEMMRRLIKLAVEINLVQCIVYNSPEKTLASLNRQWTLRSDMKPWWHYDIQEELM